MPANAELITIGDEILYGQTLDTNSHWISGELDALGIQVTRRLTISDHRSVILDTLNESADRADIVLVTGGLGPTNDDLTKPCLAEFMNSRLEINESVLEDVRALMAHMGRELNELNRLQALQPVGSTPIKNRVGTAPGIWIERN